MAQYKVIQDIEAEDKLVGPLTLRQFIYAGISAVCLYICFLALTKGFGFLTVIFLPVAFGSGFFAFPWRGEQPTEIWALARIRFSIKPRVRIWDQDGAKDLVTVIAPKKLPTHRSYKSDMSQLEVRSRLKALADTIDSRGWATRNAAYGMYNQQWNHPTVAPSPEYNQLAATIPSDDMFDEQSSVAQNFDAMLTRSQSQKRERVMQQMSQAQNPLTAGMMAQQQPLQPQQPAVGPQYGYTGPQLPSPIMPAAAPAIVNQSYDIPQPAAQTAPAQPTPTAQSDNSYWFTGGPAYPTTPIQTPVGQGSDAMAPAYGLPAQDQATDMPGTTFGQSQTSYQQSAVEAVNAAYGSQDQSLAAAPTLPAADASYRLESDAPIVTAATPTSQEDAMAQSIKQQNDAAVAINYGHMRVLQPSGDPFAGGGQGAAPIAAPVYSQDIPANMPAPAPSNQPVTRTPDPAILDLANNDDLNIDVLARQAKREMEKSPDEVEIRLH